jgi:glycosyltransferase involved in cell wall biosynthesis
MPAGPATTRQANRPASPDGGQPPLVSICIPAHDSVDTVGASVESALAQSYPALEVVVIDDASTDGTLRALREYGDPRLRLIAHRRNHGPNETANAAVAHSRGGYIKFLHHDDLLEPDCVSAMAAALDRHPSAGFAFSRRAVAHAEPPVAAEWPASFESPYEPLAPLNEVNDGAELLARWWQANQMRHNLIGEPVAVMARRTALQAAGLFHLHVRQLLDAELWIRLLARSDAVFVDRVLGTYARRTASVTARNMASRRQWVDRAWLLETVSSAPLPPEARDEARRLLHRERSLVQRTVGSVLVGRTRVPLAPAFQYFWWRARNRLTAHDRPPYGMLPQPPVQEASAHGS